MILFCIPYAGSSADIYSKWDNFIDKSIKVYPIELNGRGKLFGKDFYQSIEEAIDDIFNRISDKIENEEYAIYGHSMGSLLAYELYNKIKESNMKLPKHIFFSGCRAPDVATVLDKMIYLDKEDFKKRLIEIGGISEELAKNNVVFNLYARIIRNDLTMVSKYKYKEKNSKIECSISVLNGKSDIIAEEEILPWKKHTINKFNMYYISGNHFFINDEDNIEKITQIINMTLLK